MSFAFFFFACIGKQIDDMRGREFTPHISYDEEKRQMIGTSAQKLREIYPELVSENEDGKMAVSYEKLSIIALAAIDKLHKENEELKVRLKRIEEILGL